MSKKPTKADKLVKKITRERGLEHLNWIWRQLGNVYDDLTAIGVKTPEAIERSARSYLASYNTKLTKSNLKTLLGKHLSMRKVAIKLKKIQSGTKKDIRTGQEMLF